VMQNGATQAERALREVRDRETTTIEIAGP
jgi:hypothetical protein